MSNRIFFYPDFLRYVLFTADTLDHMYAHAQRRLWRKEAGGEIYAINPDAHSILITAITGPNPGDRRGRHSFNPDIEAATRDRERQFSQGRYTVGLWHTHPETNPVPSEQDRTTTKIYLDAFEGDMKGFLLVILGNSGDPLNMATWLATVGPNETWIRLEEIGRG